MSLFMRLFASLKHFICAFCIALVASFVSTTSFACESNEFSVNNICVENKFQITTTNMSAGTEFKFYMSAKGTFYVDWGDGNVETITRTNTTDAEYTHTYTNGGTYTIGFSGQATGYASSASQVSYDSAYKGAAISFYDNKNVAGISGSLGAIFGTLTTDTNNQPRFHYTFYNNTNLTGSIPEKLFEGISGAPADKMFRATFSGCSGLTGYIPYGLFSGITGTRASYDFFYTMSNTNLDTSCPENTYQTTINTNPSLDALDGHPICAPCPAGTTSSAGATDSGQCIPLEDCGVGYEKLSNMSSVAGISSERNDNVWSVVFPYGTISGTSACLDVKKTKKGTTDETINVEGGTSTGQYCWCQADGGVWTYDYAPTTQSACEKNCTRLCGEHARDDANLRAGLFSGGSIAYTCVGLTYSCPAGEYLDVDTCKTCESGYWCPGDGNGGAQTYSYNGGIQGRKQCSDGTMSPAGSTSVEQCVELASAYTITYDYTNGGSGCDDDTYTVGTAKELSCVPTQEGYTFDGWYDAINGGNKIETITILDTGDKTLYAQWTACTLCSAGTGATCTLSVVNNTCTYTTNCEDGYNNIQNNGEYNPSCSPLTYNIIYDYTNGGSGCDNEAYTTGTAKTLSCVPTKEGYTFDGWYDATTGGNKVTSISVTDTGDRTYYAQWNLIVECTADEEKLSNMSSVAGISSERNDNVWSVVFPYGTISGTSACLDVKKTKKGTTDETINVEGGTSTGQYCWCQADGGVWTYDYEPTTQSACEKNCTRLCGEHARDNEDLRAGLFSGGNISNMCVGKGYTCPAGEYLDVDTCKTCESGYWCPGDGNGGAQTYSYNGEIQGREQCQPDRISQAGSTSAASCECKPEYQSFVPDSTINGTSSSVDENNWSVNFDYGTLSGFSACLSASGSTVGQTTTGSGHAPVFGNEGEGKYCWCKMEQFVESGYVYAYTPTSIDACNKNCPSKCAEYIETKAVMRESLFNSMTYPDVCVVNNYSCPAGEYLDIDACKTCESGYWCSGDGNGGAQTYSYNGEIQGREQCPDGTTSSAGATSIEQCVSESSESCEFGYHKNGAVCEANIININWMDASTESLSNGAGQCTYGGDIITPSIAPFKKGYTFRGWQVKQALFDLRTLADKIDIGGDSIYARGTYKNADYCFAYGDGTVGTDGPDVCTEESAALSDISMHQWKTKFSYGTVKGIARCSTTPGEWLETGNPVDSGGGQYCWCQASGYDAGNSGSFANVSSPSWVFSGDDDNADDCANNCALYCANNVLFSSDFRSAVFGVSNN